MASKRVEYSFKWVRNIKNEDQRLQKYSSFHIFIYVRRKLFAL